MKHFILRGIKFTLFAVAGVLLLGYLMMYLWNWLVPELFNGPSLSLLQAIGLFVLAKLLFGGFKHKGACWGGHCGELNHRGRWKQKFEDKMSKLSPEEKEKFRQHVSERCRSKWGWGSQEKCKTEGE